MKFTLLAAMFAAVSAVVLEEPEVAVAFSELEKNDNITRDEAEAWMRKVFNSVDKNGDKTVSKSSLIRAVRKNLDKEEGKTTTSSKTIKKGHKKGNWKKGKKGHHAQVESDNESGSDIEE